MEADHSALDPVAAQFGVQLGQDRCAERDVDATLLVGSQPADHQALRPEGRDAMTGDLLGAWDDPMYLVANPLQGRAPIRWQGIEVLVDEIVQPGSAPLEPVGDLAAGMSECVELLWGQHVNQVASYAHDVVRGSLHQAIPAAIGEDGKGSSPIICAGFSLDQSCGLHAIDLVGEPTARGEGKLGQVAHADPSIRSLG